ncbi:hypothetical protein ABC733_28385 [Mangrovibacter sp. SLW1]
MNMPLHDMPIEELIRTARSYATSMTPITTYTEIMHELINRVDVLRVRGKVLANENAAIKCMNDCLAEELRIHQPAGAEMHLIWQKCETPLTDEAITAIRAEGVEMFAEYCQKRRDEMMKTRPNEAASNEAITATRRSGEFALYFATQLRQGGDSL